MLTFANGVKAQTYYVEVVGAEGDADADYSLGVATEVDDYGSTSKTEGNFETDNPYPGEIQWANDQDWIKLSADPLALYRIRITDSNTNSTSDTSIELVDSKGNEITEYVRIRTNGDTSTMAFFNDSSRTSTVYLSISGSDEDATDIGYEVFAEVYLEDDYVISGDIDNALDSLSDADFWA
ncbi:hypothetical protein D779_3846 [Imhoffiella purpurea]|uniref:Uncharacterized protein n=1 Tax=Imhoffiella purpurea TaxID=1249627 RepID=W9VSK4_9GAMM|nr:hypothetical protein D779_3846 [Imhoffiella purpurea]